MSATEKTPGRGLDGPVKGCDCCGVDGVVGLWQAASRDLSAQCSLPCQWWELRLLHFVISGLVTCRSSTMIIGRLPCGGCDRAFEVEYIGPAHWKLPRSAL